jgi:predicted component of type VI protein secretion system
LKFEAGLPGDAPLEVELRFRGMSDFEPAGVAAQVPGLVEALGAGRPETSARLDAILHAPAFQRLEASWRSLQYLLRSIGTSATLKVRVLHATKRELLRDLRQAPVPARGAIFEKIHGEPYNPFAPTRSPF